MCIACMLPYIVSDLLACMHAIYMGWGAPTIYSVKSPIVCIYGVSVLPLQEHVTHAMAATGGIAPLPIADMQYTTGELYPYSTRSPIIHNYNYYRNSVT